MDEPEYAAFSAKFVHFTNVTPEAFEAPHDMPYSATMCIHLCIVSTVVVSYIPHDYRVAEVAMSMRQTRGPGRGGAPVHDVYSRCLTYERVWGVRYHQIRGSKASAGVVAPSAVLPRQSTLDMDFDIDEQDSHPLRDYTYATDHPHTCASHVCIST